MEPDKRTQPPPRLAGSWGFWPWAVAFTLGTLSYLAFSHDDLTVCTSSNGIYTVDPHIPRVQCLAVRDDRVFGVGSYGRLVGRSFFPQRVYNLPRDAIIVPGLADAHAHIIENGLAKQLSLVGAANPKDVIDRVRKYILAHPDIYYDRSRWIQGMGWDQTIWPEKEFPTSADLENDRLLAGRPIALRRVDGHAIWVSQVILDEIGDLPPGREIEGGRIVRDADDVPTGVFVDNAMSLVPIPPWTDAEMELYFDTTMREALGYGLTSIHDADSRPADIEFFKRKADDGALPIHLYLMANYPGDEYWGSRVEMLHNYGKDGRLTMRSTKLFADGALGSWGAALLEPYLDRQNSSGLLLIEADKLEKRVRKFCHDGWQVNIHCIGDRANHIVLDIFEKVLESGSANAMTWRPRIEHAQIMTQEDLERTGRLGVIPSVQPTHATSDMWYAETRLGLNRIKGAYAYQTLHRTSQLGVLPLGSDFPVEGVNPLLGFYAAITRLSVEGDSPHGAGGWNAGEKLTRAQALKGMTFDAAYASFNEDNLGSLTPGKHADFVVLDRDIMDESGDPADILRARVLATVVGGRVLYGELDTWKV